MGLNKVPEPWKSIPWRFYVQPERLADIALTLAEVQTVEAYEDYFAALIRHYLNWQQAHARLRTAETVLEETRRLHADIMAKQRRHVADQNDVDKIRLQVLSREAATLDAEAEYARRTEALRPYLPEATAAGMLEPGPPADPPGVAVDFEEAWEALRARGRTLRVLDLLHERARGEIDLAAEDLLPSVEFRLGYVTAGDEDAWDDRRNDVFAGVAAAWPLWNRDARLGHEAARAARERRALSNRDARQRLRADLKALHAAHAAATARAEVSAERVRLAERVRNEETRRYWQGRSDLNDVIQAANALAEVRYQVLADRLELGLLSTEWRRLTDQLVAKGPERPDPLQTPSRK